uniref:ZmAO-1 n=1 Tax=Arundo donax TaxID=35708 RepID=A0A0A9CY28_ARUDO
MGCRPPVTIMSVLRSRYIRTGRRNLNAASAQAVATGNDLTALPPKPPPTLLVITRTLWQGKPRHFAMTFCAVSGHWLELYTTMQLSSSGMARAVCVSM